MVGKRTWWILAALTVIGCSADGASRDLITVTGITPRSVESGDTIQITGLGFAEGAPARVAFRGDIFRAGQVPQRDVEVVIRTRDTSKDTISFVVNEELARAFSGTAGAAVHAAFRGSVTLAFTAAPGSLAPVTGTLRDVTLELVPRATSLNAARDGQQLARDALSFLGLGLTDEGATDCCVVATSQGRALMAGIKPGDRIVQFDGLPVRSMSDLIPAGRNRTAALWLRRDNATRPVIRDIDVQGFRWAVPSELAPSLGALVFVLGILSILASPFRRMLSAVFRLAQAIGGTRPARPLRSACNEGLASFRRQLSDLPLPDLAAIRIAQVLAVVALGGLCGVLVTREELISGELDLLLWWLVSTLTVSAATWVQSVSCAKNRLFNGACHAAQAFVHQLPMLLLILASVGVNGSSRLSEMVRNQGLWPNRWSLFHDPAFTALGFVAMGLVIPSSDGVVTSSGADCPVMSGHSSASAAALLAFVTNRLHVWLQSILLAILLFGGWAVETEPSSLIHRSGIGAVVASLVLITKAWLITALLMGARRLVRGITFRHTTSWTLKYGVPLMLVLGALALSWVWVLNRWSVHWANTTMHWALVSVVIASLLVAAVRARGRNRNGAKAHLEAHWL